MAMNNLQWHHHFPAGLSAGRGGGRRARGVSGGGGGGNGDKGRPVVILRTLSLVKPTWDRVSRHVVFPAEFI